MQSFEDIHNRALERKGGEAALAEKLPPKPLSNKKLAKLGDDRFLAEMTRCIFQAGFVWRVINNKWPDFETVFFGFDPLKMTLLSPEQLETIGKDERIVRNMQKILTVPKNAQFILDVAHEHGSFAQFIANWPCHDITSLWKLLKKKGQRLGGMTGSRVLRNTGKDTFQLTGDVIHCLQQAGADIKGNPTSQKDLNVIQDVFNQWHEESGLPYAHISRICACSTGENY